MNRSLTLILFLLLLSINADLLKTTAPPPSLIKTLEEAKEKEKLAVNK